MTNSEISDDPRRARIEEVRDCLAAFGDKESAILWNLARALVLLEELESRLSQLN